MNILALYLKLLIFAQKVKIKCGTRPFYDHEYELKDVKYDLFGNEIEGSGCPRWGCCYDVAQTGEVQLIAINNTLLDQTNKMYNQTIQEITHHLNATIDFLKYQKMIQNGITVLVLK